MRTHYDLRWFVKEECPSAIFSSSWQLFPEDAEVEEESSFLDEHGLETDAERKKALPHLSANLQEQMIELYDKFRPRLLRYIQSMYLSREQAEEVIQETFTRLTKEFIRKSVIDNVQGWIVRVAHNLSVDLIKKKERDSIHFFALSPIDIATHADPSGSPEEEYLKKEKIKQMEAALLELNPRQRQCFHMRVQGFRYKDIAGALGVSEQRAALIVRQVSVRLAAICG